MKKFILLTAVTCLSLLSYAQISLPDISEDSLKSLVKSGLERSQLVGMSLGIIQDGELAFADGFGLLDATGTEKVTANSVFALASLSKAFTACGIGLLVDAGKLNWKDKVVDVLPGFKMYDPYVNREITVEDLLCHRNGYNTFDGDLLWYTTSYTRHEILDRFANLAPKHGFRNEYGYQNTMFLAAALVIEEITGTTWEDFMQTNVLDKLGMKNSYTDVTNFPAGTELAYPHVNGKKIAYQNFQNVVGAVGINSSINDLSIWAKMWLNHGKHGEEQFLSEASWQKCITAHQATPTPARSWAGGTHLSATGLGWFLEDVNGNLVMDHSGGLPGFLLNLVVIPEKNTAIIVLSNGDKLLPFAVTRVLMDQILKEDVNQDWVSMFIDYEKGKEVEKKEVAAKRLAEKNKKLKPSIPGKELVGSYEDDMYGTVRVFEKDGKNILEMTPAKELFTAELVHWFNNTYQVQFKDPYLPAGYVTFENDSHGEVTGFKIDLPNGDFHFYNLLFKKLDPK